MGSPVSEEIKKSVHASMAKRALEDRKRRNADRGIVDPEDAEAEHRAATSAASPGIIKDDDGERETTMDEVMRRSRGGVRIVKANPKTDEEYEEEFRHHEANRYASVDDVEDATLPYQERIQRIVENQERLRKEMRRSFLEEPITKSLLSDLQRNGFGDDEYYLMLAHFLGINDARMGAVLEMILDLLGDSEQINIALVQECDQLMEQLAEVGMVANELKKVEHHVKVIERNLARHADLIPMVTGEIKSSADALREKNVTSVALNFAAYAVAMGIGLIVGMGANWDLQPVVTAGVVSVSMMGLGLVVGAWLGFRSVKSKTFDR